MCADVTYDRDRVHLQTPSAGAVPSFRIEKMGDCGRVCVVWQGNHQRKFPNKKTRFRGLTCLGNFGNYSSPFEDSAVEAGARLCL